MAQTKTTGKKAADKKVAEKKVAEKGKKLLIIESPSKIKTLKKILGSNYKIEASMGHVRDLPKSEMGVDLDGDFEPKYITIRGKGDLLAKLRKEVKDASHVYLATDPDREGEAISWHLTHALKPDPDKTSRITFNEITKAAVTKALKEDRQIDMDLVDAQQARRVVDRIVGYKISPLLWSKVRKGLSAGRVQSVALRLICDREDEIRKFVPVEYWSVELNLKNKGGKKFTAKCARELPTQGDADLAVENAETPPLVVTEVKRGSRTRKPQAPFTTSSLQQEASKRLSMTASKTMQIAQQLYEGVDVDGEGSIGLVSYIRTDSVRISDDAYNDAKGFIEKRFGAEFLPQQRNEYKAKGRAQEAHEAIRPTYTRLTPDDVKNSLTKDQFKLYDLIWRRFLASQMTAAIYDTVQVKIDANGELFRSSGSVLKFEGFKRVEGRDDEDKADLIPDLTEGETVFLVKADPEQHFTQPPPRFNEAMLVKTLEENGLGRPSTYAPTIMTIIARNYVRKEAKAFIPTELGEIVNDIMKTNFPDIVDVDFTARMEEDLDKVEDGEALWKSVVGSFYEPLKDKIRLAEETIAQIEVKDEVTDVICEKCGRNMVVKMGRFGKFLACPGFPECRNSKPIFEEAGVACPVCGKRVVVKKTRKGRVYYGCEGNPECSFMSWNKPTGKPCPKCGSPLEEKNGKARCSNAECKHVEEL